MFKNESANGTMDIAIDVVEDLFDFCIRVGDRGGSRAVCFGWFDYVQEWRFKQPGMSHV